MILKEVDQKENLNRLQKCGHDAEKQMAFYLKRAFQDKNDLFVINDLRFEFNEDIAQIDHLIIHKFGFIVVESKSVTSKISINEYEEWIRHYSTSSKGMPSPIKQAERQIDLLVKFLTANCEHFLKKVFLSRVNLSGFKFDVLVAISDNGIIQRDKNLIINEVMKADQVTERVNEIIAGYARTNEKLLSLKMNYHFRDSTMEKIATVLVKSHKPRNATPETSQSLNFDLDNSAEKWSPPKSAKNEKSDESKFCSKCRSSNVNIAYGRFGYYFKCSNCGGNTAIKPKCKDESCKVRIRKSKLTFYKECSTCGVSEIFFKNERPTKR